MKVDTLGMLIDALAISKVARDKFVRQSRESISGS